MKKRQAVLSRVIKRGSASLFVCAVILGLPVLSLKQWHGDFKLLSGGSNKATPLPAFQARAVDQTNVAPQLFDEPLISITFDDGWETTYTAAAPLFMRYGIHSTQYLISGVINDPAYLSLDQAKALHARGQEIACHTVNHPDLTKLNAQQLAYQLGGCQTYFGKYFGPIKDFAAPYGHTDTKSIAAISQYYWSERNSNGDISNGISDFDVNLPTSFDPHDIIGASIRDTTTIDQIKAAVDYTVAHNGWLVLTYHQAEDDGSKFSLNSQKLEQQLAYLSNTKVRIATVNQVMSALPASRGN
jgi:peptidoglycan/xylan/chitin deacetylase (PgdA/CDA1 family)